jgi:hypothetical protein
VASVRYEMNFGTVNAGGAPAWTYFVRQDTGLALTQPTIVEAPWGNGAYYFDFDWSGTDATTISYMATLNGVDVYDVKEQAAAVPGSGLAAGGQWTREDLVTYVKHLLFEDAATTSLASLVNIQTTIDVANRTVWALAVKTRPSLFEKRSADLTYAPATGYYDLTSLEDGSGLYLLSRVHLKVSDTYYALHPFDGNERLRTGPEGVYGVSPVGYLQEGERLYLLPKPSENKTIQLTYIPQLAPMTTGTSALGGVRALTPYHPLVAYEAALTLAVKDEADPVGLKLQRDELRKQMIQHLSRSQLQRPRGIREVPFV